jgi:hypothetical protein
MSSPYPKLINVRNVEILHDFTVNVTFSDKSQREIDLKPYLRGPIFEPVRTDFTFFRRLTIERGALAWPNGADIDTDTLYYDGPPPWIQEQTKPKRRTATPAYARAAPRSRKSRSRKVATAKKHVRVVA